MVASAAPSAEQLAAHLADEARLYSALLELGDRERAAVVAGDPADLNRVVAEKEQLLASVARAESARLAWIADWAAAGELDPAAVTLNGLVRTLPAADAAAIAPLRDLLLQRVRDVAQMNHDHGQLVQGALRIVNGSIEVFTRIQREFGYQPTGQRLVVSRTAVLDFRA